MTVITEFDAGDPEATMHALADDDACCGPPPRSPAARCPTNSPPGFESLCAGEAASRDEGARRAGRRSRVHVPCPEATAEWSPQKRKCVTQITDGRGAASYIGDNRTHTLEEGEHVMTWTSDRAGVVLYTVLGTLIVLSSIYIPA